MTGSPVGGGGRRHCEARKANGTPCRAAPLKGERWCRFHHPDRKEEHRETSARGGAASWRRRLDEVSGTSPTAAAGILAYLVEVMAELRRPNLDGGAVTRLRAAVYAASNALEAARQAEYGDQLDELSETLNQIRQDQEAADLRAAQRAAGTLPPWERGGEIAQ